MTVLNPPLALQATGSLLTASALRNTVELLAMGAEGVEQQNDLKVQLSSPTGRSVAVTAGRGLIVGDSGTKQGSYVVVNDGTVDVALDAGDSNPRIDLIVAEVVDATIVGGGTDLWRLRAVKGTPHATTPVCPSVPVTAIPLAQVEIVASMATITDSAKITDRRYQWRELMPQNKYVLVMEKSSFSVASGAETYPSFPTPVVDGAGLWATNRTEFTVGLTAMYEILGYAKIPAMAAAYRAGISAVRAGSRIVSQDVTGDAVNAMHVSFARRLKLTAGETIKFGCFHELWTSATFEDLAFSISYVGPKPSGNVP